jgi:hypothetical protein
MPHAAPETGVPRPFALSGMVRTARPSRPPYATPAPAIPYPSYHESLPLMSDWIEDFCEYSAGIPSPEIFHLWSAISTIAASLERRVWVTTARANLYANLFVTLVAPPAVGKSVAIDQSRILTVKATAIAARANPNHGFRFAPADMTTASLIDAQAESARRFLLPNSSNMAEYASMYVQVDELGVLMPGHDLGFVSVLNKLYDNPINYIQKRRSLKDAIDIQQPGLNILAGTQPGFLAATLPETAWSMGLFSRIIMVYAAQGPLTDLFAGYAGSPDTALKLAQSLAALWQLHGKMEFEAPAIVAIKEWHNTGLQPAPEHSRLQHYVARRTLQLLKLCMVSAASGGRMVITLADAQRAKHWLLMAEERMPDVFREMAGRSDGQVIEELHLYLWRLWAKDKKPLHQARLYEFLKSRLPSEKIDRVIQIAERSNVIARQAGTGTDGKPPFYIPKPQHEHGLE